MGVGFFLRMHTVSYSSSCDSRPPMLALDWKPGCDGEANPSALPGDGRAGDLAASPGFGEPVFAPGVPPGAGDAFDGDLAASAGLLPGFDFDRVFSFDASDACIAATSVCGSVAGVVESPVLSVVGSVDDMVHPDTQNLRFAQNALTGYTKNLDSFEGLKRRKSNKSRT